MTLDEGIIHAEDVARSNHEAATYLADEHPTQAEKCEECAREHEQLAEWLKELKAYKEQNGDCISRQAVLDAIDVKAWEFGDYLISKNRNDEQKPISHFADNLRECVREELPSVTPQQRTGRWIYIPERRLVDETDEGGVYITDHRCTCSECGGDFGFSKMSDAYCKYCGAKMEVEE